MDIPTPPQAVAALAAFVRGRLVEVSETIAPLWKTRADGAEIVTTVGQDASVMHAARQFATVVVGAAAPFAPTSYARARLIRQMHASGLLTAQEAYRASVVLDIAPRPGEDLPGATRRAGGFGDVIDGDVAESATDAAHGSGAAGGRSRRGPRG